MKQSKLIKKLRELPIEDRELLIQQELSIIENRKAIDEAIKATIDFRKTLRPEYEGLQGVHKYYLLKKSFNHETIFKIFKNNINKNNLVIANNNSNNFFKSFEDFCIDVARELDVNM